MRIREFDDLARAASAESGEDHVTAFSPERIEALGLASGWQAVHSVDPTSFSPWFSQRGDGLTPACYEWLLVADK